MKLELILFAFLAALASPLQAALSRNDLQSIIQSRKNGQPLTARERLQQEQALYQHLKSLTAEQMTALEKKLPSALLRRVAQRLRFLKQQENQKKKSPGAAADMPNLVMSGASSVRRSSSSSANNLDGKKSGSSTASGGTRSGSRSANFARMAAMARRMMAARLRRRKPKTPMDTFRGFRSFTSESRGAMREGCTYPIATESVMESFVLGSGGCRSGAAACYMKGMSCVDVGMSMMCCPPGFSSGTLHALHRMKQMQTLINQFM